MYHHSHAAIPCFMAHFIDRRGALFGTEYIKLCDKRMERQWSLEQWESLAARKSIKILPVFLFPQHWPLISSGQKVARLSIQASTSTRPWNYQVANSPNFFFLKKMAKHQACLQFLCTMHYTFKLQFCRSMLF